MRLRTLRTSPGPGPTKHGEHANPETGRHPHLCSLWLWLPAHGPSHWGHAAGVAGHRRCASPAPCSLSHISSLR